MIFAESFSVSSFNKTFSTVEMEVGI